MNVIIDGYGPVQASPLDTVRLVASALGISEVDVEPGIMGRYAIRSSAGTSEGFNLDEACAIFLNKVFDRGSVKP